jgi:hypothetical protein
MRNGWPNCPDSAPTPSCASATAPGYDTRPLSWIEIGAVAGPTAAIPSAALRALPLQIVGSGQGSVSTAGILAELPALVAEIASGALCIDVRAVPLRDVASAWQDTGSAERIVLTP